MIKHFHNILGEECILIPLCKGCIKDLEEYNPYVDSEGHTIPLNRILVKEVPQSQCENTIIVK